MFLGVKGKTVDKQAIRQQPFLKHMPDKLPSSQEKFKQEEKKENLAKRKDNLQKAQIKRRDT